MRRVCVLLCLFCGCASPNHTGVDFPWIVEEEIMELHWTEFSSSSVEPTSQEPPFELTPEEKWGKLLPPPKGECLEH